MRPLTADVIFQGGAGNYTEAQLIERLTAEGAAVGCRFDVLDAALNVVNSLGMVQPMTASVMVDTGRDVIGSLGMTMLPNQAINFPFRYRIKPWYRVQMLDGGIAEWPMGVYVWNIPNRRNIGTPVEEWDVTLGDQTHILHLAGPGPNGFVAPKGSAITDIVQHILVSELGFSDLSGIQPNSAVMTEDLHWGLTSRSMTAAAKDYIHEMKLYNLELSSYNAQLALWHRVKSMYDTMHAADKASYDQQMAVYKREMAQRHAIEHAAGHGRHHRRVHLPPPPLHPHMPKRSPMPHAPRRPRRPHRPGRFAGSPGTTWHDVLIELHHRAGWNAPWFDLSGRYRATPQPDYTNPTSAKTYSDLQPGVVIRPVDTKEDVGHLCNRVIAHGATVNGYYNVGIADLNTVLPGHPMSQQQIGFYIDVSVHDTTSTDISGLVATATAELHRRVARYQEVDIDTLAWPVHEAYDFITAQYSTDAELASGVVCVEQSWDIDLRTGKMTHVLQRIQ